MKPKHTLEIDLRTGKNGILVLANEISSYWEHMDNYLPI